LCCPCISSAITLQPTPRLAIITVCLFVVQTAALNAHHEAIFGPQSALVLSSDAYLTAQLFTRQTGPKADRQQETTTVLSGGLNPFPTPALSVSLVFPFSTLSQAGTARTGLENAILGVRYRVDLPSLTAAMGARESFVMAVGAVEMPTGTLDHDFGQGAFASVVAGLFSVEKADFSAIGYGFHRRPGAYESLREGGNVFLGGGLAWTPIDDEGRLASFQVGLSHETTLDAEAGGVRQLNSGGSGVFVHPTVLYGRSQSVLFFAQTTLPVHQAWDDPADRERFRVGGGLILKLGN
jgi:hypothetical protein